MPVVLSTAEGGERSGYRYDDRTGVSYEYPERQYARMIVPGDRFIYHLPTRGYFGSGVIGSIRPSTRQARLICDVLDYERFDDFVPIVDKETGRHFEADPQYWQEQVYWARGVRPLSDERYERIMRVAREPQRRVRIRPTRYFPPPDLTAEVDQYAMDVALRRSAALFPGNDITRMPQNNPGFDIRVGPSGSEVQFIEVKGTRSQDPLFYLSEGERLFSIREAQRFTLLMIVGIDLGKKTHSRIEVRSGAIDASIARLEPIKWSGHLI